MMGLLKVVDLALIDGGHNPLGSFCCSLFVFLGTIFYFLNPLHALHPFSLFIYIAPLSYTTGTYIFSSLFT